jgi:hypothetical protein
LLMAIRVVRSNRQPSDFSRVSHGQATYRDESTHQSLGTYPLSVDRMSRGLRRT